ncbi:hypothetical protein QQS21_007466 [Conoideocrella luteorostrata]|uniref:HIT domain-containing protein n=1 Tax=Conoideocrella luteorostrata TaxID=1105319 RepID=A0AAJ0FXD1_9HYPO|nr:hypothetical protein QQS21_007466 [Conoideocrella luteorostrata]
MDFFRRVWHYLKNLEWTEKKQHDCKFCDKRNFTNIAFEDEKVFVVDNRRKAGREHWLILPKSPPARHIRDIEALTSEDVPLLEHMKSVKQMILAAQPQPIPPSTIHSGYHRGRRTLGPIILPDIISVHHLHLHVMVEPPIFIRIFKYPSWLRLMWLSDEKVLRLIRDRKTPRMNLDKTLAKDE